MEKKVVFLTEPPRPGSFNMARDCYLLQILETEKKRHGFFTLYQFHPACLSIGRFQQIQPELEERCKRSGIELVRRPTGGRAVLHGKHEITYSLVLPASYGFQPGQVLTTYRKLKPIFFRVLEYLGVKPDTEDSSSNLKGENKELCFAAVQPPDVTVSGKKAFGNALVWGKKSFLIHGSLYLKFPEQEIIELYGRATALQLRKTSFCLKDVRPIPSRNELVFAFKQSLVDAGFTPVDGRLDAKILRSVYKLSVSFAL